MKLDSKIEELKEKCSKYETNEFLTFLGGILLQISQREENPYLKKLMSPMRQLFFLGLLNSQKTNVSNAKGFSEEEWNEMANLLHEIEMEYFYLLGFPKGGKESKEEIQKISVTMPTFMNYFFNGPLCYQEQEIERIERMFIEFEKDIFQHYHVNINDFIVFYDLTNKIVNDNLNKAVTFLQPERWQEFTQKCIAKGLFDPEEWINEAPEEIYGYANFMQNPGSILKLDINKINFENISKETFMKILEIFTLKIETKNDITYYTEENALMSFPFIKINDNEFLPFYLKQYLNATYSLLFDFCCKIDRVKALKKRDVFIENKVYELLNDFFGKDGFIYTNYSIDDNVSEQDLLVIYKGFAIIIEVKAGSYRAPMRDANKAFNKLKSDFKKIIQNAYDQTFRVKKAFYENAVLTIKNEKKQDLYKLKTGKYYNNLYSIIVTFDRFGHIQTNLNDMLEIDKEDNFPWAVNIDDLEAFMLTLKKRKNKIYDFLNFLKYREQFHGHLICSDELELCGLFLKNKSDFINWSNKEEMIVTASDLTEPIEKSYRDGMGFKNERYLNEKKDGSTGFLYDKN